MVLGWNWLALCQLCAGSTLASHVQPHDSAHCWCPSCSNPCSWAVLQASSMPKCSRSTLLHLPVLMQRYRLLWQLSCLLFRHTVQPVAVEPRVSTDENSPKLADITQQVVQLHPPDSHYCTTAAGPVYPRLCPSLVRRYQRQPKRPSPYSWDTWLRYQPAQA